MVLESSRDCHADGAICRPDPRSTAKTVASLFHCRSSNWGRIILESEISDHGHVHGNSGTGPSSAERVALQLLVQRANSDTEELCSLLAVAADLDQRVGD